VGFDGLTLFVVGSGSFDAADAMITFPEFTGPVEALSDSTEALGRRADRRVAEL
jgi:hypothetical protein